MDLPFDRSNIGLRERPASGDINRAQSQVYRTIDYVMQQLLGSTGGPRSGFLGPGFGVTQAATPGMSVLVNAGLGFLYIPSDVPADIGSPDLESIDDLSPYKPVFIMNPVTFVVPAAPTAPNTRIDIIEVRVNRLLQDSIPREQLDTVTKAFVPHSFYKTLSFGIDGYTGTVNAPADSTAALSYKVGVAGNPGAVPATTPGYVKVAEILVGSGVATIVNANITDKRPPLSGGMYLGRQQFTATGTYVPLGGTRARVTLVGGGGGSGGVHCDNGDVACSNGAGSGVYLTKELASGALLTGGAVTIGAGGAGGAAGNHDGSDGGDTSIVINGITIVAKGGAKSSGFNGTGGVLTRCGAQGLGNSTPKSGSTNYDTIGGGSGGISMVVTGQMYSPGAGGSNPMGIGGTGTVAANAVSGQGYGAGGGGIADIGSGATADHAGADGTPGVAFVEEWT